MATSPIAPRHDEEGELKKIASSLALAVDEAISFFWAIG